MFAVETALLNNVELFLLSCHPQIVMVSLWDVMLLLSSKDVHNYNIITSKNGEVLLQSGAYNCNKL